MWVIRFVVPLPELARPPMNLLEIQSQSRLFQKRDCIQRGKQIFIFRRRLECPWIQVLFLAKRRKMTINKLASFNLYTDFRTYFHTFSSNCCFITIYRSTNQTIPAKKKHRKAVTQHSHVIGIISEIIQPSDSIKILENS